MKMNGGLVSAGLGLLGIGTVLGARSGLELAFGIAMIVVAALAFIGWRSTKHP